MKDIENIVTKLKLETNNTTDITYREKIVCKKKLYIIYNEPLISSNQISDFIIRSLDIINTNYKRTNNLEDIIFNEIDNFKTTKINTFEDLSYYLNYGFTIILIENAKYALALETKGELSRSITSPQTENALSSCSLM